MAFMKRKHGSCGSVNMVLAKHDVNNKLCECWLIPNPNTDLE